MSEPSCVVCCQSCGGQHSPSCTDAGSSVTTQLQPRVWSWCWCCLHCLDPPASQPLSAQHVIPWYNIQCQTSDSPHQDPTLTFRIAQFYNSQSVGRTHLAWSRNMHKVKAQRWIIPFGTFLSDGTICIMQASQNWFLARSVKNIFTKHSRAIMNGVRYTNTRILHDNNILSLQSEESASKSRRNREETW